MMRVFTLIVGIGLVVGGLVARTAAAPSVDAAFAAFWSATSMADAAAATARVVQSGVGFDEAYARLKTGRAFSKDVPRGVVRSSRRSGALEFPFTLDVPPTYDPARRYQVRVQLHGGVNRPQPGARADGSVGALAGVEQIYVMPQSWAEAPWWGPAQVENVTAILDSVKRTYNVDENRVVLSGVSDGGTGVYFFAMRQSTPFASFVPLNGFILVLRNRDLGLRGALFPHNMMNKPFFVVNGGQDPLYPTSRVDRYMNAFGQGGLPLVYRPQPNAGHDISWWPQLKDEVEAFVGQHPRVPHPATLTWQTDDVATRNRAHWLVIDTLGPRRPSEELPDLNNLDAGYEPNFGLRSNGMRVASVLPGSNAMAFGFQPGDVVVSVNGRVLPLGVSLTELLSIHQPGESMHFVVSRSDQAVDLKGTYEPTMMRKVSPLFVTNAPTGRVDVTRNGNRIRAMTRGVAGFTVLLSPDVIDFSQPVSVIADGKTVFEGRVATSVETLMKWAARDNDRTMLYGAEVRVTLNP
ncbi:MAG: PDZ domain-containing protein [Vicinamibacterales bacterium]